MTTKLFDVYPADVQPRPAEIAPGVRIRAVGFSDGLVLIWDPGNRSRTVARLDLPGDPGEYTPKGGQISGFVVSRAPGCACGSRMVKSAVVPRVERAVLPVSEVAAPVPVDDQSAPVDVDGPDPALDGGDVGGDGEHDVSEEQPSPAGK